MGLGLILGILLLVSISRISLNLAGGLILGQVEFFLNFTLAAGQFLITLLALEMRSDFGFQFFRPPVGVGDVAFHFGGTLLKTLDVRFQSERIVPNAVSVTRAA